MSLQTAAAGAKQETAHSFAKDQLRAFVERIERLEEEKKTISDDIRDVYAEVKSVGFDTKALREIIRRRKIDVNERREQETILETYMHALGMLDYTPEPRGGGRSGSGNGSAGGQRSDGGSSGSAKGGLNAAPVEKPADDPMNPPASPAEGRISLLSAGSGSACLAERRDAGPVHLSADEDQLDIPMFLRRTVVTETSRAQPPP